MRPLLLFCSSVLATGAFALNINGFAQVTAISGAALTLGAFNETGAGFLVGKEVIIMQMQDNVIGTNTVDNINFGNLANIQQAGRYDVRTITGVARDVFGAPIGITLNGPPSVPFNIGANSSVQVITYELLGGGGNFTTTTNITALPWTGTLGGVVAFRVVGTLTLAHSILADVAGFQGGARDPYYYANPCNSTTYRASSTAANTNEFATKGQGIYKLTNTAWADGRGKILNGGGGGNMINSGGGGGGNFTAGGSAVLGWNCTTNAGGIGGIGLTAYITASRVYMGGGGGGGEGNDNVSTDGARGGGIILIQAAEIRTTGSCSGRRISANGGTAANSGNDGAGGGGAGGSIVLDCPLYSFVGTCPLTIASNGGAGGTVNSSTHGGGGGGGQGTVIFSIPTPTSNVTVQTDNGLGGCNQTPCVNRANSGSGVNNSGIIQGQIGVLPIELLQFNAIPVGQRVGLSWSTATEQDNAYFTVERSSNSDDWQAVVHVAGAGNSLSTLNYAAVDEAPFTGTSYYRLRQTDVNGSSSTSNTVPVHFNSMEQQLVLFPNPAQEHLTVLFDAATEVQSFSVHNELGQILEIPMDMVPGRIDLSLSSLPKGLYIVRLQSTTRAFQERLVVR